jgi:hypothetical protein
MTEDTPSVTRTGWIRYGHGAAVYAEVETLDDFGGGASVKKTFRTEVNGKSPYERAVEWIKSHFHQAREEKPCRAQLPKI